MNSDKVKKCQSEGISDEHLEMNDLEKQKSAIDLLEEEEKKGSDLNREFKEPKKLPSESQRDQDKSDHKSQSLTPEKIQNSSEK